MRRLLRLVHLWLGLCLSIVMTIWFVSGFVMMYADYTTQIDEALRLERMEPLDTKEVQVGPVDAARVLGLTETNVASVRLQVDATRPVWRIRDQSGSWRSVFADSGERLTPIDAAELTNFGVEETDALRVASHLLDNLLSEDDDSVPCSPESRG